MGVMSEQRGPQRLTTTQLCGALKDMLDGVAGGDSYEGSIEYHATHEVGIYEVLAAYRVGNSLGQGGVVLIGLAPEEGEVADPW